MSLRRPAAVLLALAALTTLPAMARADAAYDKVASAYAQAGGHLDPCAFTAAELKAAVRGIPPAIRNVVPALRAAMVEGIAAHARGACSGVRADEGTTGGAAPATTTPTVTTPPVTTPPATVETAPAAPAATTPTTVAPAAAAAQPASAPHERDRTPLVIALIALGALVLSALLAWGWARMRGWDPGWVARVRHGWGEAGFRTTSTWSEFTDWLRLGR